MPYIQLAVAIACEIGASSALKATHGFTVLAPSVATIALYGLSFYLFFSRPQRARSCERLCHVVRCGYRRHLGHLSARLWRPSESDDAFGACLVCCGRGDREPRERVVARRAAPSLQQLKNAGRADGLPRDRRFFCITNILPACNLCCASVNARRRPCFKTLR